MSSFAWEIWKQASTRQITRVLSPDTDWAEKLRLDLHNLDPNLEVYIFYPLETRFTRSRSPSVQARWERLRCFHALAFPTTSKKVFIVSGEGLTQKIPSLSSFKKHSLSLSKGSHTEREVLLNKLANLGYLPSELVENAGQYAVRGGVIDVFPASENYPLRIELFEDEITSLRYFHPESQRKLNDVEHLTLSPAREFIFPEEMRGSTLEPKLKSLIRSQKRTLEAREALWQRFLQKSFFSEIDYWAPLIREDEDSLGNTRLIDLFDQWDFCIEAHAIEGSLQSTHSRALKEFDLALDDGEWLPPPDTFYWSLEKESESLRQNLAASPNWLSHKVQSGLNYGPENTVISPSFGFDLLESALIQSRKDASSSPLTPLLQKIAELRTSDVALCFLAHNSAQVDRLQFLFEQNGHTLFSVTTLKEFINLKDPTQIYVCIADLESSFCDPAQNVAFIKADTVLGVHTKRKTTFGIKQKASRSILTGDMALMDLNIGDRIVHAEHGIGKYLGLRLMDFGGIPTELIEVEYRDNNKLFIPVTRLSLVQKHSIALEDAPLDRLGGQTWQSKKSKVKKDLLSIAGELLHLYSIREMAKGPLMNPPAEEIAAFAATFPFEETEDQLKAIDACLHDLKGPKPMDRLICGDVGYGKTEVALRAAHAAVCSGYQVAVLVPTTLLALQHESSFKKRLAPTNVVVRGLSRFKTNKERLSTHEELRVGKADIVIGTHSLLSGNIQFKNLGLLIVDEEQKFGVVHKEKIKKLKNDIHVISMSATPIPRTLNMSMSGLKEFSLISTPPQNRVSVKTFVSRKKDSLIKEAVLNEIQRGGQVFYVHNRVQTILQELDYLKTLLPQTKIEYVHGQMEEKELEKRVFAFYQGQIEVLLTTAIVESGLDIPTANTLIVDRADHFGLSQLYQLRGRVGRSTERGYAYFMIPEKGQITADAEERLSVLETYQQLGSGFHVASHDLEIRGAGDLLGRQQSGNISSLGFDAYSQLMQECVAEIRGEAYSAKIDPDIQIPIDTSIPEYFVPDIGLRLMIYRRLAAAIDEAEVDAIGEELEDRFASLPESVTNLLVIMRIKCQLRRLGVRSAVASKLGVSLSFDASTPVSPEKMVDSIRRYPHHYHLSPDGKLVIKKPANATDTRDVVRSVEAALSQLESWCA